MAIRAAISMVRDNGSVATIYSARDGHIDYTGAMLVNNYKTPELVNELIGLGDIPHLGINVDTTRGFVENSVSQFGPNEPAIISDSLNQYLFKQFDVTHSYIYMKGFWHIHQRNTLIQMCEITYI